MRTAKIVPDNDGNACVRFEEGFKVRLRRKSNNKPIRYPLSPLFAMTMVYLEDEPDHLYLPSGDNGEWYIQFRD